MRILATSLPFIFSALVLTIIPSLADAAIVTCNGDASDPCTACDLVWMGNKIIEFLIMFAVAVSTVMFVWAGILMVTAGGNEAQLTKAKGIFTNTMIGLILVLAAWLIIDTVMKIFIDKLAVFGKGGGGQTFGTWNEILCR